MSGPLTIASMSPNAIAGDISRDFIGDVKSCFVTSASVVTPEIAVRDAHIAKCDTKPARGREHPHTDGRSGSSLTDIRITVRNAGRSAQGCANE